MANPLPEIGILALEEPPSVGQGQPGVGNSRPQATPSSDRAPRPRDAPSTDDYDDVGSLVIDKVCDTLTALICESRLSGIGDAPELAAGQPVSHPAFASMFLPESLIPVAESVLEVDMLANPKYAGWSPGSTSLEGYAREISFWRREKQGAKPNHKTWLRASLNPAVQKADILSYWEEVRDGFSEDWTDEKIYKRVRDLVGPSDCTWLNEDEAVNIRHQITDLIGQMSRGFAPDFEDYTSITTAMYGASAHRRFNTSWIDVMLHLLEARLLTLLIDRDQRRWYGGLTRRVVLYMVAAEIWNKKIDFKTVSGPSAAEATAAVKAEQLEGIVKFVRDMQWPFADEVVEQASRWHAKPPEFRAMPLPLWDWLNGLVTPGYMFPSVTVLTVYCMSSTLQSYASRFGLRTEKGNFGVLYPKKSYWHARSIVGKVLAPMSLDKGADGVGVNTLAGWVGPFPAESFHAPPYFGIGVDVPTLLPVVFTAVTEADEYSWSPADPDLQQSNKDEWIEPQVPGPSAESVILQSIYLPKETGRGPSENELLRVPTVECKFWLPEKQLKVTFNLLFNSIFLAAPPCRGTHRIDPLDTDDFSFRTLEPSDLPNPPPYEFTPSELMDKLTGKEYINPPHRKEAITVIKATSGGAAQTFARAWCSFVGCNAVIWERDSGRSCFKCALMAAGRKGLATKTIIMC